MKTILALLIILMGSCYVYAFENIPMPFPLNSNTKCFYIDNKGNVLNTTYKYGFRFNENHAIAIDGKKIVYLIDNYWNAVSLGQNVHATLFTDGLCVVNNGETWWAVGPDGKRAFTIKDQIITNFSNGIARVKSKPGEYYFINRLGIKLFSRQFDKAGDFNEGYAWVLSSGKFMVLDTLGKSYLEGRYDYMQNYSDGLVSIGKKVNGEILWGFVDLAGNLKIPIQYQEVGDFHDGLTVVKQGGKYGVLNKLNEFIIKPNYQMLTGYSSGVVAYLKDEKYGYIDMKGNRIGNEEFDDLDTNFFKDGMAIVVNYELKNEGMVQSENLLRRDGTLFKTSQFMR